MSHEIGDFINMSWAKELVEDEFKLLKSAFIY